MKKRKLLRNITIVGGILVIAIIVAGLWMMGEIRKFESDDPLVWKKEIRAFEKIDKQTTYPENAVLFVGSSSIRFWSSLSEDMDPVPVIQRGFGGSKIGDVIYWAPELILSHKVKTVVVFVGTNDITGHHGDSSPKEVAEKVIKLENIIHEHDPEIIIYYISITPTSDRWDVWPQAYHANKLISDFASTATNFYFLDFTNDFLTDKGLPNKDYFKIDGLHLNEKGYAIWTNRIKPLLLTKQ
jgi:lysophospholipase L1-like esterase